MFKRIKDILKVFKLIILVFVYSMPKIKKPKVKGPPKKRGRKPKPKSNVPKPPPKKRGRKPKGGKIVTKIPNPTNTDQVR